MAKTTMKKNKERKQLNRMPWFTALNLIRPYVFKISTPTGNGTGFQISYCKNRKLCGIATAYHVIQHADKWDEPIEITHHESGKTTMLKNTDRVVFPYADQDLAFIVFPAKDLPIKSAAPKLIDPKKSLKQGVELGWCGFPSVAPKELCFFSGCVSCYLTKLGSYLVDGVAINGVSGGPAFWLTYDTNEPKICGVVAAYIPNRATGETLPGLCIVTSVESYQEDLKRLKSFDEAARKAAKQKEEQQAEAEKKSEPGS